MNVVYWVAGILCGALIAGIGLAWKLHQASSIGGADHDFGTKDG